MLDEITSTRSEIDRVRAANLGESVELSIAPDELRERVDGCRLAIEESADGSIVDGGFFAREPAVRDMMLATRDAATRLLTELPVAEAVV